VRKINNPHDKFFKDLIASKKRAIAFLSGLLDKELCDLLDFDTLERQDGSFVSGELEEYLELIYNFEYCIELDNFVGG